MHGNFQRLKARLYPIKSIKEKSFLGKKVAKGALTMHAVLQMSAGVL